MTQITSGDYDDTQPAWSPDGASIAFTSNRSSDPDSNYNTDIWVVDANNTDQGQTLIQVTTNPGPDAIAGVFPRRHADRPPVGHRHRRRRLRHQPPGGGARRGRRDDGPHPGTRPQRLLPEVLG